MKTSARELIVTWICLSIGIVLVDYIHDDISMSVNEVASAIYFMGMYATVMCINGWITWFNDKHMSKKDAPNM